MQTLWQNEQDRLTLLKQLVNHQSITNTQGEKTFPNLVNQLLFQLKYFKTNPNQIQKILTDDDKEALIAFYQGSQSGKTIVLVSHYDTVDVSEFGLAHDLACNPDKLKQYFLENQNYLDKGAVEDLLSEDYLFGRGIMDMKAGLMLHMSLIELASIEQWDINLILVTVPDEEVNSSGMRKAVEKLAELKANYDLDIQLHLNSEPTFQQATSDEKHYIYSGSIGKIMPAVLCYGKETHVGQPLEGLSANFMMSYITQAVEYNTQLKEHFENESTPVPVTLMMKDIKDTYDVQTPYKTIGLFNFFLFNKTPKDVFREFINTVITAVERCESDWLSVLETEDYQFDKKINVLTYEQLKQYAVKQYGEEAITNLIDQTLQETSELHLQNIHVADKLMQICKNIAPAVVTFFASPYYPAVNASSDKHVSSTIELVKHTLNEQFQRSSEQVYYFNGISDTSYLKFDGDMEQMVIYEQNTPNFNRTYTIPFESIKAISAPTLLIGPIGKDAHKLSERLHKQSALIELPVVLEKVVKSYI
ncbi:M20/M25/M40 family metallo-hydrolase [Staphylococcus ureilyticus]|uniref:M20/M25/M40 family metallo-hydrolase n=1 Tax=Staphylococcus ureilyticus TaxID=94138 RepID=UPI0021D16515|nr:M20/M25/M40 family metallo-hydrolase [Staphylococcus ureilyticus]MDU0463203.1 M20/M25/M40 family metallo-hydrolase [Staphylococcus ureilyticus]UXS59508.1 M20/M25/M40 family metallo-hydrolase [Staphylococcus ureilyticus]